MAAGHARARKSASQQKLGKSVDDQAGQAGRPIEPNNPLAIQIAVTQVCVCV